MQVTTTRWLAWHNGHTEERGQDTSWQGCGTPGGCWVTGSTPAEAPQGPFKSAVQTQEAAVPQDTGLSIQHSGSWEQRTLDSVRSSKMISELWHVTPGALHVMPGEREVAGPHSYTEAREPGTQQDDTQLCCEIWQGLPLGQQTVPGGSRGLWGSGTFSPVLGMGPPYGNCQPVEQQQKDAYSNTCRSQWQWYLQGDRLKLAEHHASKIVSTECGVPSTVLSCSTLTMALERKFSLKINK